jgi:Holliday junction DNA helicase RuvA
MIGALKGTILEGIQNPIIVMVNNVGYAVHITETTRITLGAKKEHLFYIHTHVRDDALDLYGFLSKEELAIFELLLTVSGVGPRTALLVTAHGFEKIHTAIVQSDVGFFTDIPRLGKKNAQKIIIELKSKLGSLTDLDLTLEDSQGSTDIREALLSMGFVKAEVVEVTKKIYDPAKTLPELLREALKLLSKK